MQIVEKTLTRFRENLRRHFADSLSDAIIHGSYVLGDFRPNRGDLDFVLVFHSSVTDAQVLDLFALVGDYRETPRLLLHQLEGTAYPWWVLPMPQRRWRNATTRRPRMLL